MDKPQFETVFSLWPGITYCVTIAVFSFLTWISYKPVSSLMWAFIYSIVVANITDIPSRFRLGVDFCSNSLLKGTVAAAGLVTSALIWTQVGVGAMNAIIIIFFSFFFSLWLGRKLGISDRLATLIGVGTSICGASAIAAAAPAIGAKEEETGLAIAGITIFGLVSMFLYPFLFADTVVRQWLMRNVNVYAVWVGSGVHETAQVIAAAGALGPGVILAALLVKSVRIFMIGPIVLIATYLFGKSEKKAVNELKTKIVIPVFGVVFILNTFFCAFLDAWAPQIALLGINWITLKSLMSGNILPFLLATTFAGVGTKVRFRSLAKLGVKPFAAAAVMAVLASILALVLAIIVSPFIPF